MNKYYFCLIIITLLLLDTANADILGSLGCSIILEKEDNSIRVVKHYVIGEFYTNLLLERLDQDDSNIIEEREKRLLEDFLHLRLGVLNVKFTGDKKDIKYKITSTTLYLTSNEVMPQILRYNVTYKIPINLTKEGSKILFFTGDEIFPLEAYKVYIEDSIILKKCEFIFNKNKRPVGFSAFLAYNDINKKEDELKEVLTYTSPTLKKRNSVKDRNIFEKIYKDNSLIKIYILDIVMLFLGLSFILKYDTATFFKFTNMNIRIIVTSVLGILFFISCFFLLRRVNIISILIVVYIGCILLLAIGEMLGEKIEKKEILKPLRILLGIVFILSSLISAGITYF